MQKPLAALALAAASALVLTGCSGAGTEADDALPQVVASTNVYGSIAAQIGGDRGGCPPTTVEGRRAALRGGDRVEVTSLIDSAAKDPHSYEAGARDRLAVQGADLVIENGGGYDSFMGELREESDAKVITAVEFAHGFEDAAAGSHDDEAAHDHDSEHEDSEHEDEQEHAGHDHIAGFNEHVWFDPHTMIHVTEQIATDLSALDPEGAADFTAAADELIAGLEGDEKALDELHTAYEGTQVFLTEPLAGYLASAAGLDDVAPEGFAAAVEEGNDVAPATLLAAVKLIESGEVSLVLTNTQTGGGETQKVEDTARAAGIPVLALSELLEADQTYAEWMHDAIQSLAAALER